MAIKTNLALAFAAFVLPFAGICAPAAAHGALAVGSTSNVSKDGIAVGTAINHQTIDSAKAAAMEYCTTYKAAPKAATFCRLVETFTKECYAVAFDPKAGTPGAGWAIAADIKVAEQRAIDACKATAGNDRAQFCKVDESKCDTVGPVGYVPPRQEPAISSSSPLPAWRGERPPMPVSHGLQDLLPKDVFRAVAPSVYWIKAGRSAEAIRGGEGSQGSAVAVSDSWALTNCHVVKNQQLITLVDDQSNKVITAAVVRADEATDRCFLRANGKLKPIASVKRSGELTIGERVYTIGNPQGLTKTLGEGLISGLRSRDGIAYVQTTAPISRGSSGGALVDSRGSLIGITTFLLKDAQSLNFAISAGEYWR